MEINQRIADIISHYGIEQKELAAKIEVTAATISKIVKGLSVPGGRILVDLLLQYPEISAEWLMRGEGEMLINKNKLNKPQTTITLSQYDDLLNRIEHLADQMKELKNE